MSTDLFDRFFKIDNYMQMKFDGEELVGTAYVWLFGIIPIPAVTKIRNLKDGEWSKYLNNVAFA